MRQQRVERCVTLFEIKADVHAVSSTVSSAARTAHNTVKSAALFVHATTAVVLHMVFLRTTVAAALAVGHFGGTHRLAV